MTELSLSLLGAFHASVGAETLDDFRTRKVQALLIYLATEPQAHGRDALLDLFWPGLPERSARSNLRQILYYLRQALPEVTGKEEPSVPAVIANRKEIRLNPKADVTVDVWQFEALLDGVHAHEHMDLYLCRDCASELEAAVALYRGSFLSDFYLDDSNAFEDWAQARREHARRRALDALGILTTMAIRARDYAEAQIYAEKQLEIDSLRESAYRQLMETLALSGRREQALAVYETCRRALAEELGMTPSGRTTAYYEKVLAGDLRFDRFPHKGVRGYKLKEQIGEGAYGAVFRAVQPAIRRQVAVKVIARKHADDADFIRRFEAEAQTVARLEHPYIVPLYDYWRDPQGAYLVMRYMPGGSLLSDLEGGPWDGERATAMVEQIASALAVAHRQGVVHRDIKPANILLDEAGNAYLADFGIARELAGQQQLTAAGSVIGTLDYVSPEQITGDAVSPQADIYSLGTVLYETLTGERPFGDASVARLLHCHLHEPIPLVTATRPDVPPDVDAVLQKATSKEPAARYDTVQAMAAAFRGAVRGMEAVTVGRARDSMPALVDVYNPYKGLHAFQESDADDFFGREALVDQLVGRLEESRFLAVVGPSGSGKSSAVKAGLIPALRQGALPGSDKWFIAELVPGTDPLAELELALWHVAVDAPPNLVEPMQRDTGGILRTVRRVLPHEPAASDAGPQLLLVIDQFEELFTRVEGEAERTFFLDSLLAALQAPRTPLRVVVTLRADLYDRPLQYQAWGQLLKQNTEIVLPLNRTELTWAIREPAARMGIRLEEGLAGAIVADVADQPGALPLLQYTMTELFERRSDGGLTRVAYEEIGGVQGALGRRAEAIFAGLDEASQEAARQLFLRLVTLGEGVEDTRRRVLRSELEALNGREEADGENESAVETPVTKTPTGSVLERFGAAHFFTFDRDPLTRKPTVEVAHEALLREWPRLRRWLAESRDDVRLQRRLAAAAAEWERADQGDGFLLRGGRLDLFADWMTDAELALTQTEQDFLAASLAAREQREAQEESRRQRELETARQLAQEQTRRAEEQSRSARRLRLLAAGLAVILLLALGAAYVAVDRGQAALENASLAATNEAQAIANSELAVTREAEAVANANLALTRQAEALAQEEEANIQRANAEAEAEQRVMAQAEAERQAQAAFSRELAAAASLNLDDDPERSILLAMHALSTTHTTEAEWALHQAIQASRVRKTFQGPGDVMVAWLTAHPDGNRFFASGLGGGLMWDRATDEVVFTLTQETYAEYLTGDETEFWINRTAFTPDGSLLLLSLEAWAGDEPQTGFISIVAADSGEEILTFPAHDGGIQVVSVNPEGTQIASGSLLGSVKVWDLEATLATGEGQELTTLCCHDDWVYSISYSPDGSRVATTSADGTTRMWEVATGRELFVLNIAATDAVFSPDGEFLAAGQSGEIVIVDAASGQVHATSPGPATETNNNVLLFSPDGTRLAASNYAGNVRIWNYANGELEPDPLIVSGHAGQALGIGFTPDGRYLVSGSTDGTIRVWDVSVDGASEFGTFAHDSAAISAAFSPDGSWLASTSRDGTAKIWDAKAREVRFTLRGHDGVVFAVAVHPDGRTLATGGSDSAVRIWDAQTGEERRVIEAHAAVQASFFRGVADVAYSPDGRRLASGGADQIARVWDATTGEELFALTGHADEVTAVDYSSDGRWLITVSRDGTIKAWDPADGRELWTLTADGSEIWAAAFSPDGLRLATSHDNGKVMVWSLPGAGAGSETEPEKIMEIQHDPIIANLSDFSPDGGLLAVGGQFETALYDAETGERLLDFGQLAARAAVFSPDGRMLATTGLDGYVRLLAVSTDDLLALARSRVTRSLTTAECQEYLHMDECPEEQ